MNRFVRYCSKRRLAALSFCAILLLETALCCSACAQAQQTDKKTEILQTSESVVVQQTELSLRSREVILYLPDTSFSRTSISAQTTMQMANETIYEATVKTLLAEIKQIGGGGSAYSFSLLSFGVSDACAYVNLTGNVEQLTEAEKFILVYCMVNTLCEFDEISYVTILVDDCAIKLEGIAAGALSVFSQDCATAYWQWQTKAQSYLQGALRTLTNSMILYYGDMQAGLLLGEVRSVSMQTGEALIVQTVDMLAKGPRDTDRASRMLPSSAYVSACEVQTDHAGNSAVTIRIQGSVKAFFIRNGISEKLAASSVALTLFDYYPNLSTLTIYFDNETQASVESISRTDCELLLGGRLTLYYPSETSSRIVSVSRVVPAYKMHLMQTILAEIFVKPDPESGALAMMPDQISISDIAVTQVTDHCIVVDISSSMLTLLRQMDTVTERNVIYCIVNTLCYNTGVPTVRFVCGGVACGNVDGRINLDEPLMFNPGIVGE